MIWYHLIEFQYFLEKMRKIISHWKKIVFFLFSVKTYFFVQFISFLQKIHYYLLCFPRTFSNLMLYTKTKLYLVYLRIQWFLKRIDHYIVPRSEATSAKHPVFVLYSNPVSHLFYYVFGNTINVSFAERQYLLITINYIWYSNFVNVLIYIIILIKYLVYKKRHIIFSKICYILWYF